MRELAIVTNASYSTPATEWQLARIQQECIRKGIQPIAISNRLPFCDTDTTRFPSACIYLDKDVCFASLLQKRGVRVFNSAQSIALADNKMLTQIALGGVVNFPTTLFAPKKYFGTPSAAQLDAVENMLGYPLVVKEAYGSLGKQVYLAANRRELDAVALEVGAKDHLYQSFVQQSAGKSIRIYIVGGKFVGAVAYANDKDFRSNMAEGGRASPIVPTEKHISAAIRAVSTLGLDFGAADFFDTPEPLMIEVNSNAFFRGLEDTGINITEKIVDYIIGIIG